MVKLKFYTLGYLVYGDQSAEQFAPFVPCKL